MVHADVVFLVILRVTFQIIATGDSTTQVYKTSIRKHNTGIQSKYLTGNYGYCVQGLFGICVQYGFVR